MNRTPSHTSTFARFANAWKTDTWVKPFFFRYASVLALALGLGLVAFLFAGGLMFTSGYMISLAATLPLTALAVHMPSLLVRIFGVGKPVLQYLERLMSHDWVLRMTSELRRRLYDAFEHTSPDRRAKRRMGDILGLLAEDIEHIQNLYLRTIFPMLVGWLVYAALIALLGLFSVPVALALALMLGIIVFVLPLLSVCVNGARLEQSKATKDALYADLTDNVLGVADWMYSGRSADYLHRHQALQQKARAADAAIARFNRLRDVFSQAVFGACVVLVFAWAACAFGANPTTEGLAGSLATVTMPNAIVHAGNWIAAFALCFFPLIEALSPLPEASMGLLSYATSLERMNGYSDAPADGAPSGPLTPEPALDGKRPDIDIRNATFRYPDGPCDVIKDLSLSIPAGQRIAVLGRSGAGKSTLGALLLGTYAPSSGSVRIAGIDAHAFGAGMPHVVGVIQQSPHLFNWTLRDNVALGNVHASDDEIVEALRAVGLEPLLGRLPQGLDTIVDEAGRRFSGGERHRIALARVLLAGPPIVILDEPFAGLDPDTEQALIDTMFATLEGRTIVMITHHLQGVAACDRVIFVEDGGIALDGAPDQLERANERYRRLLAFDRGEFPACS